MDVYTVSFENVSVAAAQDLFEIQVPDTIPVLLHSLYVYNCGADVGDAAEENLRIALLWLSAGTPGSGGTTPTAYTVNQRTGSPTNGSQSSVAANNTTVATTASHSILRGVAGWNIRGPFERVWTPDTRPRFTANTDDGESGMCVVRLAAAPADAVSMSGELTFEELA